jgi:putative aminopeptidase FrvX
MSDRITIPGEARRRHRDWLFEVTRIPTASGREQRIIAWVERWASERPGVLVERDGAGNLVLRRDRARRDAPVLYFEAHLDHPAFVVERVVAPAAVQVAFRGGVMDAYFDNARIVVWDSQGGTVRGRLTGRVEAPGPFRQYLAELERATGSVVVGDVATWDLPPPEEIDGCIHTSACDDLAAVVAALAAFDALPLPGEIEQDVRLLFTRAEEVGFIGAIAALRERTITPPARVIALENSRSFPESPLGAGPIVRVGDRMSVFTPSLTDAVAARAEELGRDGWKWQRKLMPGGACEASVFCHAGLEATCVCLALGNYHNQADLASVQAGTNTRPATIEREYVSLSDFDGLVDLLVACGVRLPAPRDKGSIFEKMWAERGFVIEPNEKRNRG